MDIGKWKILAVSTTLICCLAVPVLAYTLYRTPLYDFSTGIVLQGVTMQLGFYWDIGCTLPVTTIDFGEVQRSNSEFDVQVGYIWIRNEGTDPTTIFWNSTLRSVITGAAITEDWENVYSPYPLNSTILGVNEMLTTNYRLWIHAPNPLPGTYNWTVTVWGESYV